MITKLVTGMYMFYNPVLVVGTYNFLVVEEDTPKSIKRTKNVQKLACFGQSEPFRIWSLILELN